MKKISSFIVCLLVLMATSLNAQTQITVDLEPGWTWIGYPQAETASIATALGDFTPTVGDTIKSQDAYAVYRNNGWRGDLKQLVPGLGYKYYSGSDATSSLVFTVASSKPMIQLQPGFTWFGFCHTEAKAIADAFDFLPMEGDMLMAQQTSVNFHNGEWQGELEQLTPGYGYIYYSTATGTINTIIGDKHDYVDLGLPSGKLWASWNIGADSPEDYGDLFAWGEVQTKDEYTMRNYRYCDANYDVTKYCTVQQDNEFMDNLTVLEPMDDAATVNWGDSWRMPTREEWIELFSNTSRQWTTQNGVDGLLITSNWNGNTIFLPAAGHSYYDEVSDAGSRGYYWSSSLYSPDVYPELPSSLGAWTFELGTNGEGGINYDQTGMYDLVRGYGLSVRPIYMSFNIQVTSSNTEGGSVSGGGTFGHGEECTVTATPVYGWIFTNWTENGEVVATNPVYTFAVSSSRTLVANFFNVYTGTLNGVFSVSSNRTMQFSKGNLQYQASTNTWRFAENQWNFVGSSDPGNYSDPGGNVSGSDNMDASAIYRGWIDLFGWGNSGYNHGAESYQPWDASTLDNHYAYGHDDYDLSDSTGMADWGYNPIEGCGGIEHWWRTLTGDEWDYVINTRSTSSGVRFAKAQVNGVNGLLLLPDNWSTSTYSLNNTNQKAALFTSNVISVEQWNTLEEAGVVFLPAGGRRDSYLSIRSIGNYGYYWSSTHYNEGGATEAKYLVFNGPNDPNDPDVKIYHNGRNYGMSVRLATAICPITVTVNNAAYGSASGGGVFRDGDSCTLVATPVKHHIFLNWTENGQVVSTDPHYTFKVDRALNLVANFDLAAHGAILNTFTVGKNKQVYFSQGNLQYNSDTQTWRFAQEQWEYNTSGWIDRFIWGSSGWNNGFNIYYHPTDYPDWNDSNIGANVGPGNNSLTGNYADADWGVYNAISNGGNQAGQWRTLTSSEWNYVFFKRSTPSGKRFAIAKLVRSDGGVTNGCILLPDDWDVHTYELNSYNVSGAHFEDNQIPIADWNNILEPAGAVFLPAAGRQETFIYSEGGQAGYYWSSTNYGTQDAYLLQFYNKDGQYTTSMFPMVRYKAHSVRLVHDAE